MIIVNLRPVLDNVRFCCVDLFSDTQQYSNIFLCPFNQKRFPLLLFIFFQTALTSIGSHGSEIKPKLFIRCLVMSTEVDLQCVIFVTLNEKDLY